MHGGMRLPGAFATARRLLSFVVIVIRVGVDADAPRHLVYPPPMDFAPTKVQLVLGLGIPLKIDESAIMGYVMKYNYKLPHNASYLSHPYVRLERSTADEDVISDAIPGGSGSSRVQSGSPGSDAFGRYAIYKMVESAIDSTFQSGKACLLRAICELVVTPLNFNNGILAQLIHAFLTPSSTAERYVEVVDQEYLAAESIGHRHRRLDECIRAFGECDTNFLDYFSNIH